MRIQTVRCKDGFLRWVRKSDGGEERMLMLSLDDAVKVAKQLVIDGIDDEEIIRQEIEQKCWIPPETNEAAKRLNGLIFDINPAEICAQIEADNLKKWCETIQTVMKMAMVQLPCWSNVGGGA